MAQIEIVSSRLANCISPVGMPVRQQLMLLKSRTFYFSFVSAAIRAAARNRLGQLRQSNLPAGLVRNRRPPGLATPRHPIIDQRALIAGVSSASSASVRCVYRVAADAPCARSISRGLVARTGGIRIAGQRVSRRWRLQRRVPVVSPGQLEHCRTAHVGCRRSCAIYTLSNVFGSVWRDGGSSVERGADIGGAVGRGGQPRSTPSVTPVQPRVPAVESSRSASSGHQASAEAAARRCTTKECRYRACAAYEGSRLGARRWALEGGRRFGTISCPSGKSSNARVIEFGDETGSPRSPKGRESLCPHVGLDRGRQPAVLAAKSLFPARSAN